MLNAEAINNQPAWKLWATIVLMPLMAFAFVTRFLAMVSAGDVLPRDQGLFFPLFIGCWGLFMAGVAGWVLYSAVLDFRDNPKTNWLPRATSVVLALSFIAIGGAATAGSWIHYQMMTGG